MSRKSYEAIFNARGESYNAACSLSPMARQLERKHLIDLLDLHSSQTLLDIPAGGGYLADGVRALSPATRILCLEPSVVFCREIGDKYPLVISTLTQLPLPNQSVERVASLAGIHHLVDKQQFVNEVFRVLRPGGVFAVADVRAGSSAALFLNDTVDRLSVTGHQGMFLNDGEMAEMMRRAGFNGIRENYELCAWRYRDRQEMGRFCKLLFGLHNADEIGVIREIETQLIVTPTADGIEMEWGLIYAAAKKT